MTIVTSSNGPSFLYVTTHLVLHFQHSLVMVFQCFGSLKAVLLAGNVQGSVATLVDIRERCISKDTIFTQCYSSCTYLQSPLIYLVLSLTRCSMLQQDFYQLLVVMHCSQVQSSQAILHRRRRCSVSEPFSSTALSVSRNSLQQYSPPWHLASTRACTSHSGCTLQLSSGQCGPSAEVSAQREHYITHVRVHYVGTVTHSADMVKHAKHTQTHLCFSIYVQPGLLLSLPVQQPLHNLTLVVCHRMVKRSPTFL